MRKLQNELTATAVVAGVDSHNTPATLTTESTDTLLTTEQLRQKLQVSRRTISNWRERGILPAIKLPGASLVRFHWGTVLASLIRRQRATE